MKEMQYTGIHCETELDAGTIKDFQYKILSYGTHPCAYVRIPKGHPLYKNKKLNDQIAVHGGITYCGTKRFDGGYWIGWDYGHWNDRLLIAGDSHNINIPGHEWTTVEILEDVEDVISQLDNIKQEGTA